MNVVPKETLFSWLWRKTHKENLPPPPPPPSLSLLLFFTYYHFNAYKEMVLGSADTNNPFF